MRYGEAVVALKALAALVRAEFRQRVQAIIAELKETDAGQVTIPPPLPPLSPLCVDVVYSLI